MFTSLPLPAAQDSNDVLYDVEYDTLSAPQIEPMEVVWETREQPEEASMDSHRASVEEPVTVFPNFVPCEAMSQAVESSLSPADVEEEVSWMPSAFDCPVDDCSSESGVLYSSLAELQEHLLGSHCLKTKDGKTGVFRCKWLQFDGDAEPIPCGQKFKLYGLSIRKYIKHLRVTIHGSIIGELESTYQCPYCEAVIYKGEVESETYKAPLRSHKRTCSANPKRQIGTGGSNSRLNLSFPSSFLLEPSRYFSSHLFN